MSRKVRPYLFYDTTQSVCTTCLHPVEAKILVKDGQVFMDNENYEQFHLSAEVLGDAITADIAAAWDEVYWLMATELVAREARLYQERDWQAGQDWPHLEVVARETASTDTVGVSSVTSSARHRAISPASPSSSACWESAGPAVSITSTSGSCNPAASAMPRRASRSARGPTRPPITRR